MDTSQKKQISVARMGAGQSGTVVQMTGGHGLSQRLQALGVRPGKKIQARPVRLKSLKTLWCSVKV